MAERPEDLNLPITVVQRLIKEALPDGVIVSKEARHTISRASSVFVLYLTACAVAHANKCKRKTLSVNDILAAISDMEFDSFLNPLNEALKMRKDKEPGNKKQSKVSEKTNEEGEEEEVEGENEEGAEVEEEEANEEAKKSDLNASNSSQTNNKRRKLNESVGSVGKEKSGKNFNPEPEIDEDSSSDSDESTNENDD